MSDRVIQLLSDRIAFMSVINSLDSATKERLRKDKQAHAGMLKREAKIFAKLREGQFAPVRASISLYNTKGCKHMKNKGVGEKETSNKNVSNEEITYVDSADMKESSDVIESTDVEELSEIFCDDESDLSDSTE